MDPQALDTLINNDIRKVNFIDAMKQQRKAKAAEKNINWYTLLPKGPPPRKTLEEFNRTTAVKAQLRAKILKKYVQGYNMPQGMTKYQIWSQPPPAVAIFDQSNIFPNPFQAPVVFNPPHLCRPASNGSTDDSNSSNVDYTCCGPDCWCLPPTSAK